jgi:hypothetical protein
MVFLIICINCFNTNDPLNFAHTVYLRVSCDSQNKPRLYPYIALAGWSL